MPAPDPVLPSTVRFPCGGSPRWHRHRLAGLVVSPSTIGDQGSPFFNRPVVLIANAELLRSALSCNRRPAPAFGRLPRDANARADDPTAVRSP